MDEITLIVSFAVANTMAIIVAVAATHRMIKNLHPEAHLQKVKKNIK